MENRAFQEMLKPAVWRIQKKQPQEIAKNAGVDYDKERSVFTVTTLGKPLSVAYPSCELSEQTEEWHTLLLLHYLDTADGTPLTGKRITFGALKDGLVRGTKFDRTAEEELQRLFRGKEPETIREICQRAGANFREGKADLYAEFSLFPRYPLLLEIWFADDEFPLSGKLFVDGAADHYLGMEDAVTAGMVLLEALKEAASRSIRSL